MDPEEEQLYSSVSELLGPFVKEMQYWEHAPELRNRESRDTRALDRNKNQFVSPEVYPYSAIRPENSVRDYSRKGQKGGGKHEGAQAGGHSHELSKAAEYSNMILEKKSSPFRVSIFKKNGKLFIKLLKIDRNGKTVSDQVREVTHNDFIRLIEDVLQIEGLWVDDMA